MIDGSVLQSVQRCFEKKSRVVVKMVVRAKICLWGLSLSWVLLWTWSAHRYAKHSRDSAFWFFFSVHNHGLCDGPNTFSQEKQPCLSQLSYSHNLRNIESSRSTYRLNPHWAFGRSPHLKHSRASAFWFLLFTTMDFAAAVRTHFPRKTPACLVDRAAINKQLFKN